MSQIYNSLEKLEMEKQGLVTGRSLFMGIFDEEAAPSEPEVNLRPLKMRTERRVPSLESKEAVSPEEQGGRPLSVSFVEMVTHIKKALGSLRSFAELSQGKFGNEEFGNHFCKQVNEDLEKTDSELDCFLDYVKVKFPARKTNRVHHFLEVSLKNQDQKIVEKKIKIVRKPCEGDLPETRVRDEQLGYILNWILQYVLLLAVPDGHLGILTKSFDLQEAGDGVKREGLKETRYIEVLIALNGWEKPPEVPDTAVRLGSTNRENGKDLILSLVEEIVRDNGGKICIRVDQEKRVTQISLVLPAEKGKVALEHQ